MRLSSLAPSIYCFCLFVCLAALHAEPTDLPPAAISPPLKNNSNPPMVAKNASGTLGSIERLDPALDELLAPDAKIEILVEGIQWAEGPVWCKGGLLFSDVPQNTVYRWTPEKGVGVYLQPSGYTGTVPRGGEPGSNGLTLDHEGRLVLCQHGDRRVVRLEKDGKTVTPLAERFQGKRFNSPNDLCFDAKGNLYFTDPSYGLWKYEQGTGKEMDVNGVYLARPDGQVTRTNTGIIRYANGESAPVGFPNGIALSPDEKALYICTSDSAHPVVLKYDIQNDGDIANGKVFFDATPFMSKLRGGIPDGMKVDLKGNLWATGPGGVFILTPEGKHLGTILTGERTANCAWGDDGSTLYMCADHRICRVKTKSKGMMPGT